MYMHECNCSGKVSFHDEDTCRYMDEHMKYWCESRRYFGDDDFTYRVSKCNCPVSAMSFTSYDDLLDFYNFLGEVIDNYDVE